jgi:hypothetical protein
MTKSELLKIEHQIQLKWLDNQMAKIANQGAESFSNVPVSERAYHKMKKDLIIDNSDIEHFVSTHLSETGLRKLVTTLRVYLKRSNAQRLQVEITKTNKDRLDQLVEISGKTKIEIINLLISQADLGDFKKPEEQLELQCN